MSTSLRRLVLCFVFLALLLVSSIVPVFIILGIQQRWIWFFPYVAFVLTIIFLLARFDRADRPAVVSAPGFGAFVSSHVVLTMIGLIHAALLVSRRIGSFATVEIPWPEVAAALFLVLVGAKWLLMRTEAFRTRPQWFEVIADSIAFATLFASAIIVFTTTGF